MNSPPNSCHSELVATAASLFNTMTTRLPPLSLSTLPLHLPSPTPHLTHAQRRERKACRPEINEMVRNSRWRPSPPLSRRQYKSKFTLTPARAPPSCQSVSSVTVKTEGKASERASEREMTSQLLPPPGRYSAVPVRSPSHWGRSRSLVPRADTTSCCDCHGLSIAGPKTCSHHCPFRFSVSPTYHCIAFSG